MESSVKALVFGRVQGVGYRLFCKRKANELGIVGRAVNLADGRVEVIMCGDAEAVSSMIDALYVGPAFSNVLSIDLEEYKQAIESGFHTG